jgi:hypothetical protein
MAECVFSYDVFFTHFSDLRLVLCHTLMNGRRSTYDGFLERQEELTWGFLDDLPSFFPLSTCICTRRFASRHAARHTSKDHTSHFRQTLSSSCFWSSKFCSHNAHPLYHVVTTTTLQLLAVLHPSNMTPSDNDVRPEHAELIPLSYRAARLHAEGGVILLGNAWNLHYLFTVGGMIVVLTDLILFASMIAIVSDLADSHAFMDLLHQLYLACDTIRTSLSSVTINILMIAVYDLFDADGVPPFLRVPSSWCHLNSSDTTLVLTCHTRHR